MDLRAFTSTLRRHRLYLFTLRDVENLFPRENKKTIKNNLGRWLSKGYCARLRRGLYEFVEPGAEFRIPDLYVANRLYEPSYVSLETALSFYSMIPDVAAQVTSLTPQPTRTFKTKYGSFAFRTCRPRAFSGYRLMSYEGFKIKMAQLEKALVDFLYYRVRSGRKLDFDEERLNKTLLRKINWRKARSYAGLFNPKTREALRACRAYVRC